VKSARRILSVSSRPGLALTATGQGSGEGVCRRKHLIIFKVSRFSRDRQSSIPHVRPTLKMPPFLLGGRQREGLFCDAFTITTGAPSDGRPPPGLLVVPIRRR